MTDQHDRCFFVNSSSNSDCLENLQMFENRSNISKLFIFFFWKIPLDFVFTVVRLHWSDAEIQWQCLCKYLHMECSAIYFDIYRQLKYWCILFRCIKVEKMKYKRERKQDTQNCKTKSIQICLHLIRFIIQSQ